MGHTTALPGTEDPFSYSPQRRGCRQTHFYDHTNCQSHQENHWVTKTSHIEYVLKYPILQLNPHSKTHVKIFLTVIKAPVWNILMKEIKKQTKKNHTLDFLISNFQLWKCTYFFPYQYIYTYRDSSSTSLLQEKITAHNIPNSRILQWTPAYLSQFYWIANSSLL